jgi:hypothetical protein
MAATPNTNTRRAAGLAALGCALVFAACGSSGKPATTEATGDAAGVKFATCMRTHGISSFPDPEDPADVQIPIAFAKNRSPAFTSAMQACKYLIPSGSSPPVVSASQQAAAVKLAQCIREHGVPNYPDPTYQDGHQVIPPPPLSLSQFNELVGSPAFSNASKACQSP